MKLLQSLIDQGIKQDLIQSARQERARADAAWMKQVRSLSSNLEAFSHMSN